MGAKEMLEKVQELKEKVAFNGFQKFGVVVRIHRTGYIDEEHEIGERGLLGGQGLTLESQPEQLLQVLCLG